MDSLKLLSQLFEKDRERLVKAINAAKHERDNAASPMESHHDNVRADNERLVRALEEKLNVLDKLVKSLPSSLSKAEKVEDWRYVEVVIEERNLKLLVVPKGFGGGLFDGIRLVSLDTQLGREIDGMRVNERFALNSQQGKVINIE